MKLLLKTRRLLAFTFAVLLASSAVAQEIQVTFRPGVPDPPSNWTSNANWDTPDSTDDFPPEGQFREIAVISSGGTAFIDSPIVNGPGEIFIPTGTLEIRDTGNITLFDGFIDGDSNGLADTEGNVTVGFQGTLRKIGGGQLTANRLVFNSGASVFDVELSPTSTPISVVPAPAPTVGNGSRGDVVLNGVLNVDYSGITNPSGSYQLISGDSAFGNFGQVNSIGLGPAQTTRVTVDGGLVSANVINIPTLTIDRSTGLVRVDNTHNLPISLDGIQIASANGSFNAASATALGSGWSVSAANDANSVAQLFEGASPASPSASLTPNSMSAIGANLYQRPAPAFFQQDVEDVQFFYTDRELGVLEGIVTYVGDAGPIDNDIVLYIDNQGDAAIRNASAFVQELEAYRITSSDGSLLTSGWVSLDDSGADGGIWTESGVPSANELLETVFNFNDPDGDNSTTFDNTVFNLGRIFNTSGDQEGLAFEFLLAGDITATPGSISFIPEVDDLSAGVVGDYNGNGTVDAADYTVWRDSLGGSAAGLQNRDPANTGLVSTADYNSWKSNFGNGGASVAAASAVPEPCSLLLLLMASIGVLSANRRNW